LAYTLLKSSSAGLINSGGLKASRVNLLNQTVKFRKRDVFWPEPAEMLLDLHGNDPLEGTIVALCDNDSERDAYVVIKVEGIARPLMVPTDHVVLVRVSRAQALEKKDEPFENSQRPVSRHFRRP